MVDFRGFDSSTILIERGGILRPGFPRKFESSNVSRDNVSREIGRNANRAQVQKEIITLFHNAVDPRAAASDRGNGVEMGRWGRGRAES